MSSASSLSRRLAAARVGSSPVVADRARRGLTAYLAALVQSGAPVSDIEADIASGKAAQAIGRIGLSELTPRGLACAQGCAFCCILTGEDGGTMTESEAVALHGALIPLAGEPDGRSWHPKACAALDPETQTCRAYDARPMICRAYVSTSASACKAVADGAVEEGPGTLDPYHTYLAAIGLSRAAMKGVKRVSTYSLSRLAAAAVKGLDRDAALAAARHKPSDLDSELRRSKRDRARVG